MRIEGLSSTSSSRAATVSDSESLSAKKLSTDFMNLLITQLQNQDPLQPMADRELMTQLAQLSSLESLQHIDALTAQGQALNQLAQGAALIGHSVSATVDGVAVAGKVSAATVGSDEQVFLTVGDHSVALANVQKVTD